MEDPAALSGVLAHGPQPSLLGGDLCLDFANTVSARGEAEGDESLHHYADLVRWLAYAQAVPLAVARELLQLGERQPEAAGQVLAQALALRETLYRVFLALAHGTAPPPADLQALGAAYRAGLAHAALLPAGAAYVWAWAGPPALEQALWPLAQAAVALLAAPDLSRVKECANHASCGWLFLDRSKNGSRRWCSMDDCGSRDKMRRQYARRRDARTDR